MSFASLLPRQPVPDLSLKAASGGSWSLAGQSPENFTMIVFYRGYHCPICSNYIGDLDRKFEQFADKGVSAVAVSSDNQERAEMAKDEWKIANAPLAYGLPLAKAREWGLFISSSRGKTSTGVEEPALFSEPGVFLVRPDGTLYWSAVQTMPFARPHFAEILGAVDKVLQMNYPARGEIAELPAAAE